MKKLLNLIMVSILLFSFNLDVTYATENTKNTENKEKAETGLLAGPAEITVEELLKENKEIELKEITITNTGMNEQEVKIEAEGNLIVKDKKLILKPGETKKTMMSIKVKEGSEGKITDHVNVNTVAKNGYQAINLKLKVNYEVEEKSFFEEYKVNIGIGILFMLILLIVGFTSVKRKNNRLGE